MSITSLIRPLFLPRAERVRRFATQAEKIQSSVLERLLERAAHTEWGLRYEYGRLASYEQFAEAVPLSTYEELKGYIDRMRHGESDVLWPGRVKWYAKSSGTTNDKSKFIPVSLDGLHDTHYAGGTDTVALYLANHPASRLFDGRALILGGSHAPNYNLPHSLVGDLSAILIENINPLVNLVRVPSKRTALLADFEVKRDRIARETAGRNVTNLSGVPSWMLSVLHRVLEVSGCETISDVWPNLEVFFHGGVAFTPYREEYRRLIPSAGMNYMETYNASEGFFGLQSDPADPAMLLMLDYGVFYEFIPLEQLDQPKPQAVPLWGVEPGRNYAMVIRSIPINSSSAAAPKASSTRSARSSSWTTPSRPLPPSVPRRGPRWRSTRPRRSSWTDRASAATNGWWSSARRLRRSATSPAGSTRRSKPSTPTTKRSDSRT